MVTDEGPVVVFVCDHGAAKSVIAAALLERHAAAQGRDIRALARGTNPDPEVPALVRARLRAEGIAQEPETPARPTPTELSSAERIVSFGPLLDGIPSEYRDVPSVAADIDSAWSTIDAHVAALLRRI